MTEDTWDEKERRRWRAERALWLATMKIRASLWVAALCFAGRDLEALAAGEAALALLAHAHREPPPWAQ